MGQALSLHDLIEADTSGVFLNTNDFAESITHRPAGNSDNDTPRTVVFIEDSRVKIEDHPKGKRYFRNATIRIASSVTVTKKDEWIRNSEKWQTVVDGRVIDGMKQVLVTRTEQIKTEGNAKARREF